MHMSENILPVFAPLSSKAIDRKKCSLVPRPPLVHTNGRLSSPAWKGLRYLIKQAIKGFLKEHKCV